MALIVRIDVDRPYGRAPVARHLLSRLSSDLYFPTIEGLGYLSELSTILSILNENGARAHVFFRRCTLPTRSVMDLLDAGRHVVGLHLENSRSYETFAAERAMLERHIGRTVASMSKHGSGGAKYGLRHYAPYEPERYVDWAARAGFSFFSGNQEDPTVRPQQHAGGLAVYPAAFWLEPSWRDTQRFTIDWLRAEAATRDVVMLIHPENVLASPGLLASFRELVAQIDTAVVT